MATIAIIGGGAAGASVFGALLAHDAPDTVHWITGTRECAGRGLAYNTAYDHHLLNVRAAGMGLYTDADEDFAQYSRHQRADARPTDFLPRRLFGEYIEAQLTRRLHHAQQRGRRSAITPCTATRLRATRDGYEIALDNGEVAAANQVVLALGALTPRPLRTISERALAGGAYVLDPWRLAERSIQPRRLIVIGTGLTAVDTLITASIRWPDCELVAVSRHGLLPFVHPALPIDAYPQQAELNARLMACDGPAAILAGIRRVLRTHQTLDWRSVSTACGRSTPGCGRPLHRASGGSSCGMCAGCGNRRGIGWRRSRQRSSSSCAMKAACRSTPRAYWTWMAPAP